MPRTPALATERWWIVGLLFLATVLNYLDRQVLSVTAPVLRHEFGMAATGYSRIVFAFLLAYTAMQAVMGRVVDLLGPKRGLSIAMIWWSTAAALHALAGSVFQLGFFRFLLGMGEAGNWPASVKAIQQHFPPKERALAVGIFNSGSAVGAVMAPPIITWLTIAYSWRAAFLGTGLLGFLWIVPWTIMNREAPNAGEVSTVVAARSPWRDLLTTRHMWGLMAARFCGDPVWWFYVFWLPDYLSHERHLSLVSIGTVAWLPFLTAGLGNVVGGWASGILIRKGVSATFARKQVMAICAGLMTIGVFTVRVQNNWLAVGLVSLATFAYGCWATNILTLPADTFAADRVGAAAGLAGMAAGIGGMLTTLAIGWIVDHFSYAPVFSAAALLPLLGAAGLFVSSSRLASRS